MRTIVVVSKASDWPLEIPGAEPVLAKDYLIDPGWTSARNIKAFNLCRSYRYQSEGYYVSLLGAARHHRPFPSLMTVLDMRSRALVRTVDDDLDALIQKSLGALGSKKFELSIYFGKNLAKTYNRLARSLFATFPAPLLRASFTKGKRWRLSSVTPIAFREVPESHHEFFQQAASEYFGRPRYQVRSRQRPRFDLAILYDPAEELAPSGEKALACFAEAGEKVGFGVEMIRREDYGRLGEFDALFIRETTAINHHTFRFAQRAEADGLIVIDDPQSILRCTNKVFQSEAFGIGNVPTPKTLITDQINVEEIESKIGFPCVLKYPDSSFSRGVIRCNDRIELEHHASAANKESDLLLVQEYMPTDFDWRIGIFNREALFACRYHMAKGHWQIVKQTQTGRYRYGHVDTLPLDEVPPRLIKIALRAAATIGDGLYGVDLKEAGRRVVVTEVNDNPNIDCGCEDVVLKKELYRRIMSGFLERVEKKQRGAQT
ncbi:MAG: glutathione synthase/RimK-type ligase-like ATP-grasp enzyme [Planctomycetota bacterium]|jgi:glutathione synthase/RimK-type ligase-like ATP-grasp enzyme